MNSHILDYLFVIFIYLLNANSWQNEADTPLWRNGPPGKPVLCNACGSRWRTKGTLANYAPLHSRGPVLSDSGVKRNSREHKSSSNKKPQSLNIRTQNDVEIISGDIVLGNESSTIGCEDDTSNRSSSGSRLSFSESTVLLGSADGIEISGKLLIFKTFVVQ